MPDARELAVIDLSRLLNPKTIAVIGGGAWCASIIKAARMIGFAGEIFPVHPDGKPIAGLQSYRSLAGWDGPIDAAFIGVNRTATIDVVRQLRDLDAGGAVCFASGFSEALNELSDGADLQAQLLQAAGEMPILGPNCYGFINALDGAAIWPDQHGCQPVESGVAILTQSSNIAINLTMQNRALPIAYMVTCGNMAQTTQAQIAMSLLDDPRVTAIGLHIEGFADITHWHALALKAYEKGVPLIALKVGKSELAQQATISHTASLAGGDAGAQAVLERFGIARVADLPGFLETLKLMHCNGRLESGRLASISCSGGEASLIADTAHGRCVHFPPLTDLQISELKDALGPKVSLANPLDYHTYIWRDTAAMARAWAAMAAPDIALTLTIVDYPRTDPADWDCATQAALQVRANTGRPIAVVATLPELMPPDVAQELLAGGVTPMHGLSEAIAAAEAASFDNSPVLEPPLPPGSARDSEMLRESDAKLSLAQFGLSIPEQAVATSPSHAAELAAKMPGPVVLKGVGFAHKSEAGAVRLSLQAAEVAEVASAIPGTTYLVEEMITDGVAELLVGVVRDPAHGFVLTLAAGGTLTELLQDSVSLLIPASDSAVKQALKRLKTYAMLSGFRGKPAADIKAIVQAVAAIQTYVVANANTVSEVEVNPLICTPDRAVAADALIRKAMK